jgi:hypothetical protein
MPVIWLTPVQDRVQETLGAVGTASDALPALLERLSQQVGATFPRSQAIVVVNRLEGYSSDPAKHVLRVEVLRGGRMQARVVKIAPPKKIAKELNGWKSCERPVNERGRVFMHVEAGKALPDQPGQFETLVYEDAYQTLRAARVVSLEDAVLSCCRWGTPTTASLLGVLDQVFAELADRLYRRSWSQTPDQATCAYWRERIELGRQAWTNVGTPAEQSRDAVLSAMLGKASFVDPCACVERILTTPAFLPEMRRGCAHGDLHGRNTVVGVVDGQALFPAIFDYEDMTTSNYLGWDFVKLETEMKVRALAEIQSGDDRSFMEAVYNFEDRLAQETESRNNQNFEQWVDAIQHSTDQDRLLAILLGIRRQAKRCLEVIHKQNRTWLHEYYFLLACYGLYAGRFNTYRRRDQIACVLCAGFSAARYAWAHTNLTIPDKLAEAKARQALADADSAVRLGRDEVLSHRPELIFATVWTRSRQEPFVRAGIQILESLRQRHDRALEIWQELALAHFELYDLAHDQASLEQGERVLLELDVKCPLPHRETLCRWGRLWKDRGDRAFDENPEQPLVAACYQKAWGFYQRAYDAPERHYYPGINVATLALLLKRREEAEQLAREILEQLQRHPQDASEETVWVLATQAEAFLLIGDCGEAARLYRTALLHPRCQPQFRDAMAKQVRRILRIRPCADRDFDQVFAV